MGFRKTLISLLVTGISVFGCAGNNKVSVRPVYQENLSGRPIYLGKWFDLQFHGTPKTKEGIQEFLYQWIIPLKEKKEDWNSPRRTLELGYGDCEEIATTGSWLATFLGYPPKILLVKYKEELHAITLLEKKSQGITRYGIIEHSYLMPVIFSSLERLVKGLSKIERKDFTHYAIIDLPLLDKDWDATYKDLSDLGEERFFCLKPVSEEYKTKETRYWKIGRSIVLMENHQ